MTQPETETAEQSPLFLALTRPIMVAGVTYNFMVLNAMVTTLVFLASGSLLMFLIGIPIHLVGYALSLKDPRIFDLISVAVAKHGNCHASNKSFWKCNSYAPDNRQGKGTMAINKTQHGNKALNDKPVSQFVPYSAHVNEHTVSTREGYLIQTIELDGLDFETLDNADLNSLKNARNNLWKTLSSSRLSVSYHIIRSKVTHELPQNDLTGFAKDLDQQWHDKLSSKNLYINKHYVTLTQRPKTGTLSLFESIKRIVSGDLDRNASQEELAADLKSLNDSVAPILTTLKRYTPKRLSAYQDDAGIPKSQLLEFLYTLINQDAQPVALPHSDLASYLPAKRMFFGKEALELRGAQRDDIVYGAMIGIKEYTEKTFPGMMDHLLRSPSEMVITQHFSFIERPEALSSLKTVVRQMDMAEDAALSLQDALHDAMDDAESRRIVFGQHQLSILVKSNSTKDLDQNISETMGHLRDIGIIAVREDMYMEASYWSQLPGNLSYQARSSMISSQNFASFASFHNFPTGQRSGNHWGDHVCMLETTSGAPYYFNFHHHDVGNFNLFGPTGSGKTVLLLFLLAQAQKFKPRSVFFDKDRGAEVFIRAMGGQYAVIEPGKATGFNPLTCADTQINRAFLREWLSQLLKPYDGTELCPSERATIASAIEQNFNAPLSQRRLCYLADLFRGHERSGPESLEARLAPWHSNGERAWLFDHEADQLQLDNRLIGFDMTSILDDPTSRTPALLYMFHRINELLNGDRFILFIDEGWKALDDPAFERKIKDWLKTIRKQNGLVGFGSQSVTDALNSRISDSLIEQCSTQIFMPNNKANAQAYAQIGVTPKEFEIIKNTDTASHEFLIKHGQHSVIAKLDLSNSDTIISILSGGTQSVLLLNRQIEAHGEDPKNWLSNFEDERLLTA